MRTSIRWKGYNWHEVRLFLLGRISTQHSIKKNGTLVLMKGAKKLRVPIGHYIIYSCGEIDVRTPDKMESCL